MADDAEQEQPQAEAEAQPQAAQPRPESEVEKLKRECSEYKDKYLRQLAESENMRKRLQKERQDISQYATESVIIDFLSPIDHMETALRYTEQMSDEVKHWALGFNMILTQFKDALANNGVKHFESVGKHFDPHMHEAIEMAATDKYPPGIVVEESVRGYKMGDKIIRPARVKVSKALSSSKDEKGQKDNKVEEL